MIQIAVVIEALGRGGAERLLVDTARLLDRSRFQMHVHTLFTVRRDYESALRGLGIAEVCLGLRGHMNLVSGVLRLRAMLERGRPDIVHTHLFFASQVGRLAARLVGCPVVSTMHGADYEPSARLGNPGLTLFKQSLLQAGDAVTAAVSGARIIAVSQYVADSARRRLGVSGVEVIPNAVDTETFCPDPSRRAEVRQALGLGPGSRVLICVGRMTDEKGQGVLIRAMPAVRTRISGTRLLLVGEGPSRVRYESLAHELGVEENVSFLGVRWDVPDLLRAADVLVMPSLNEGFGLVMVEALASGTPVVASRMGPTPEIVRETETGLLFTPGDPRALADALERLLGNPALCHDMGRRGREDALARFALPQMVRHLERLYETVHAAAVSARKVVGEGPA